MKQGPAGSVSTVPYYSSRGWGWLHTKWRKIHTWLCAGQSRSATETRPPLCVETSCYHHNLWNVSQSLPVDMGQVFCGNSFQDTQVQQPPEHTYQQT